MPHWLQTEAHCFKMFQNVDTNYKCSGALLLHIMLLALFWSLCFLSNLQNIFIILKVEPKVLMLECTWWINVISILGDILLQLAGSSSSMYPCNWTRQRDVWSDRFEGRMAESARVSWTIQFLDLTFPAGLTWIVEGSDRREVLSGVERQKDSRRTVVQLRREVLELAASRKQTDDSLQQKRLKN